MLKRSLTALGLALVALAFASPAQANKPKFGAQGALVVPMSDFGDAFGLGFGGFLTMDLGLGVPNLQLTGRLGVIHFGGKERDLGPLGTIDGPSVTQIPILAGVKYFVIPGLYLGAELGLNYWTVEDADGEMEVAASLGAGYMIKDIDIRAFLFLPTLFPEGDASAFDFPALGISVGYRFFAP